MNSLVSKLVIGTAQFGLDYGINNKSGKVPKAEVYKILDLTKQNGIELVDTAQAYGDCENVLGCYLQDRHTTLKIISKLRDCPQDKVEVSVHESLDKLHTNNLYGILLHNFDTYLKNPLIYRKMFSLKDDCCVAKVGFSLYYPSQLHKILDDKIEIDFVQVPYNLLDRRFESCFRVLHERNIEIHVRSVFLQGLLFIQPEDLPSRLKEFSECLSLLQRISTELGISIQQLALLFVATNSFIDKAVIGIDNLHQITDDINALCDNTKLELVESEKHNFSKLEVKNETILVPSNWN